MMIRRKYKPQKQESSLVTYNEVLEALEDDSVYENDVITLDEHNENIEKYKEFTFPVCEHKNISPSWYPDSTPLQVLKEVWGYDSFRDDQEKIVSDMISGKNVFVVMKTGGGKSLCYQLPALMMEGTALIVSPLISLIADQVQGMNEKFTNREPAAYFSGDWNDKKKVLDNLEQGKYKAVFISPERLLDPAFQDVISRIKISMTVLDEAHCIPAWGRDFRRNYTYGAMLIEKLNVPKLFLTATIDSNEIEYIREILGIHEMEEYHSDRDRPNIFYDIVRTGHTNSRIAAISYVQELISVDKKKNIILYRNNKKDVDSIYLELRNLIHDPCIRILKYHADMNGHDKDENLKTFRENDGVITIATMAFGIGIDKPNVSDVVHIGSPSTLDAYSQETGRAGRNGMQSKAVMFISDEDIGNITRSYKVTKETHSHDEKSDKMVRKHIMKAFTLSPICLRRTRLRFEGGDYTHVIHGNNICGSCRVCEDNKNGKVYKDHTDDIMLLMNSINNWKNDFPKIYYLSKSLPGDDQKWSNLCYQLIAHEMIRVHGFGRIYILPKGKQWMDSPYHIDINDTDNIHYANVESDVSSLQLKYIDAINTWLKTVISFEKKYNDTDIDKNDIIKDEKIVECAHELEHNSDSHKILSRYITHDNAKVFINNLEKSINRIKQES